MKFVRILALPVAFLYGFITLLRNKLYDVGIFPQKGFEIPVISVGNLSMGGTGKTPHIEYLIRLLKPQFYISTLSRGYGRKSSGFKIADTQSGAMEIGDEPMQFKKKFTGLRVAVDSDRVRGVSKLLSEFPSLQAVLLDDALQHRKIRPGISILLSDFSKPFWKDLVVPSGTLREFRSGAGRADIIIVTKCPHILLPIERKRLISEIRPKPYQHVYFSYLKYGEFIPVFGESSNLAKEYYFERSYTILLLTGIATTRSLEYYLKGKVRNIVPAKFPDHHLFTKNDLEKVLNLFDNIASANKIILTTEKDAMRLRSTEAAEILRSRPVFYIPIEAEFHDKDRDLFNEQILHYVRANQKYGNIHSK